MSLEYQVAGILSTIDFDPSTRHPEAMLPWARLVLLLIDDYESDDASTGATIDELIGD